MLLYQSENFGRSFDYRHRYHDGFVVPAHIHEYSEILYVIDGEMTMQLGADRLVVPAGHLAFVAPHVIHAYTDETPCRVRCSVFSNDFIACFLRLLGDGELATPVVDMTDCKPLLEELDDTAFDDALRLTGLLSLICSELLRRTEIVSRPREGIQLYQAAVDYVSRHYTEDISLSDVATVLGYHEKYLSSALHSLTGMHFCMFLASYRVEHAKRLFRAANGGDLVISQVAMESGFSSINTFNRTFKRLTGLTPGEYCRLRTEANG